MMKKIFLILFSTSLLFAGDGFLKKAWARLNELTMVSPAHVAEVDEWMMTQKTYVAHYDAKTGHYRIESYWPSMQKARRVRFFDDVVNVWKTSHSKIEMYGFEVFRPNTQSNEEE